ncbi:MAG TPA: gamma-glutamyltransferase [Saprospiraceae bacterium]|nr:gamma-glutamyltransferase [Saprospiraceae bacterium]
MKFICLCFHLLAFALTHISSQDRITGKPFATRSEVIAQNGMAATSHPLATQIALDILKSGGNAVDAAIAANAALGLMEPTGCGIGGDLFAIIWDAREKKLHGLNASGRSPGNLSLQWFIENEYTSIPPYGPLPVTVPGAVDGWFSLHGKFGKLPMEKILQPAIRYAEKGFPVTELIAFYLNAGADRLKEYDGFSDIFLKNGKTPQKGEIFKNPDLASTYKKIAAGGRDAFYKGEIAETIAEYIRDQGGFLSYEDLATHSSEWVDPVSTSYRGYDVWEMPPNGQGIAALQILNILEHYNIAAMGFGSADYIHVFTEAKKLAFEDRARYYADMSMVNVPVDWLISKEYASERQKLIDMNKAAKAYDPGELSTGETIYLTVADGEGNMISLIQSNYRGMGSGMSPPGLGFVLHDRGEMFSLEEGHPNAFAPNKRPFHTIIPCFITKEGNPWVSFGVMGGAMQPLGHAQIAIHLIDFGMNLQEAGDAPRIYHSGSSEPTGERMEGGGLLHLESGISYEVIRNLMSKGHKIQFALGPYGGYQAILWDEVHQVYYGASESRKDGQAAGY